MNKNKAVIIGASYYIGLSAVRCLGKQGVPVTAIDYSNVDAYALRSRWCREKLIAPHYRKEPEAFIQYLVDFGKRQEHKPVLFPTADSYAGIIDQNYNKLREYFLFPDLPQGYLSTLMDKDKLHALGTKHGMAVPESLPVSEIDQVEKEIGYPCLLKPTSSPEFVHIFRVKVFVVNNRAELEQAIAKAEQHNLGVIIQRLIPGFDDQMHTYDAYVDKKGEVTHWTTCRKKRQYPANFGASVFTEQKHIPQLHEIGSAFYKKIGYRGFGEIEFKYDPQRQKFYMIEINVRLSNLNAMLAKAGLNFPYIMYRDLTGNPLPPKALTNDSGYHFWSAIEDALAIKDYLRKGQLKPGQIAKSLFTKKVPSVWDWQDPAPALGYGSKMAKRIGRKILRRNK